MTIVFFDEIKNMFPDLINEEASYKVINNFEGCHTGCYLFETVNLGLLTRIYLIDIDSETYTQVNYVRGLNSIKAALDWVSEGC